MAIETVTVDNGALSDINVLVDNTVNGAVQAMKLIQSTASSETPIPADASGLLVNLGANNDVVATVSGTVTVDGAVNSTIVAAIPAGTNNIGKVVVTDGTDDALVSATGRLLVDNSGVTQPVSAAALPLPTGAATQATLASILTALADPATETTLAAVLAALSVVSVDDNGGSLTVDGPVTDAQLRASAVETTGPRYNYVNGTVHTVNTGATEFPLLAANANRNECWFQNQGATTVYIGKTGMTATSHVAKLLPGEFISFTGDEEAWFAIEGDGDGTLLVGAV